jgi:uncharacterized OB-fold protein
VNKTPTLKSNRTLHLNYNIPISKTSKFWNSLRKGKVFATICKSCGKKYFPPVADCGACLASNMKWVDLDGEGEVIAYTKIIVKPASFSQESPYTVAIARLKDDFKVLAWLVHAKNKEIKIGLKVKLITTITSDGIPKYEFRPIAGTY